MKYTAGILSIVLMGCTSLQSPVPITKPLNTTQRDAPPPMIILSDETRGAIAEQYEQELKDLYRELADCQDGR